MLDVSFLIRIKIDSTTFRAICRFIRKSDTPTHFGAIFKKLWNAIFYRNE